MLREERDSQKDLPQSGPRVGENEIERKQRKRETRDREAGSAELSL